MLPSYHLFATATLSAGHGIYSVGGTSASGSGAIGRTPIRRQALVEKTSRKTAAFDPSLQPSNLIAFVDK